MGAQGPEILAERIKGNDMIEALRGWPRRLGVILLTAPIHLYRLAISPFFLPACRFAPSCSAYALEAMEKHGPVKGCWLSLHRLSRCHPITVLGGSSGYDPVPGPPVK